MSILLKTFKECNWLEVLKPNWYSIHCNTSKEATMRGEGRVGVGGPPLQRTRRRHGADHRLHPEDRPSAPCLDRLPFHPKHNPVEIGHAKVREHELSDQPQTQLWLIPDQWLWLRFRFRYTKKELFITVKYCPLGVAFSGTQNLIPIWLVNSYGTLWKPGIGFNFYNTEFPISEY